MIIVLIGLVTSAVVLGCLAGPAMDRLCWPVDHPGAAVACWMGALSGTFLALTGALVVAFLWPPAPGHGVLEWLHNCLPHHQRAGVAIAAGVSLAVIVACAMRLACGVPRLWRAIVHRRRHRQMLHLIARKDDRHVDVLVLDHPVPVAYCLPSRDRSIVVSTGARERLSAAQLRAVLAHERTHLRQRHHMLLLLLDLAYALLPWLPTVRRARGSLPPLLEMAADDDAARRCGRFALTGALRKLAPTPGLAGGLAATGSGSRTLSQRLARLDAPIGPTRCGTRALAWTFSGCAIAVPLAAITFAVARLSLAC
jgi:hypothetical protein